MPDDPMNGRFMYAQFDTRPSHLAAGRRCGQLPESDSLQPLKFPESRLLFIYFADIRRGAAGRIDCCHAWRSFRVFSLRCPTHQENSHANHTWHQHWHETASFLVPAAPSPGFDSHRPLHSQATPGHAGLQDLAQEIDSVGECWECASIRGLPHILRYPYVAPCYTRRRRSAPMPAPPTMCRSTLSVGAVSR